MLIILICKFLILSHQDPVNNVWVNSKSDHPPPGQTPGHLTFLKMPDQIPLYMGRFLGQMPHWLGLKSHRVGFFFFFFFLYSLALFI